MKKFVSVTAAALLLASVVSLASCQNDALQNDPTPDKEREKVILRAIEGSDVGALSDVDYYVAPEPAASLKVSKVEALNFVGDLQELYGSENGYVQAVLVGKKQFIEENPSYVGDFMQKMALDAKALPSMDAKTVVQGVTSHLTEGLTPTFNAVNLTSSVIANCGVRFEYAWDCKDETNALLQKFIAINESSTKMPSDAFYAQEFSWDATATLDREEPVKIFAPDGAPALALSGFLTRGDNDLEKIEIVDASTIATYVAGTGKADLCILPVNAAAKILGNGENYQMLGSVTHGNLYLLSAKTNEKVSLENLSALEGKTVGVVNLASVPGLIFKSILTDNGISFEG